MKVEKHTSIILLIAFGLFNMPFGYAQMLAPNVGQAPMLQAATVFFDENRDGHYDPKEEQGTLTNNTGDYSLNSISTPIPITLTGGQHSIFGNTFEGILSTPKYATQITQSTTVLNFMIDELATASGSSVETQEQHRQFVQEAQNILKSAFGIDPNIDILTIRSDKSSHLFAINAALHSIMNDVAIALETAYGEASKSTETLYYETARSIAKYLTG